jgi:small subunit ribosomal protein S6
MKSSFYCLSLACKAGRKAHGGVIVSEKARKYETVFIVRPTLDDESVDRCVNTVEEFIKAQGGSILNTEKKGRKRLSYEVKKLRDGFFVVLRYEVKPEAIVAFKRMIQLNEDIIRSITVTLEEEALQVSL